ncbi:MAG TPA: PAS domain S-box protein, partial [Gemmatimonadales bacterium]|nr:PAS domain S-box protein [Gemmatimonadales bacterium]
MTTTPARSAPEAVHQSERFYRALVEDSSDLIWALDHEGRFTFVNRAAARILGYRPEELVGLPFTDIQASEVAKADAETFGRLLAGEAISNYETVRLAKDGSPVVLSISAVPYRAEDGRVVGVIGTARDLTEQRRAEASYREREELYRDIARNYPGALVLVYDRDFRFIIAEGQGLESGGLRREDLEGRTIAEVVPAEFLALVDDAYRGALEGRSSTLEAPLSDRVYQVQFTPVRSDRGEILAGMVISRDVTAEKHSERLQGSFIDLGRRLSAARTPEEAARIIVQVAQDLVGWDSCSLDIFLPDHSAIQTVLTMDSLGGPPVDVPPAYPDGPPSAMALRVLHEGAQFILRAPEASPTDGLIPFGANRRSASLMFVPIRYGAHTGGILSIQSYTPLAYEPADLDILQALADHCGGALERLRVERALRESQAQLARAEALSLVMTAHLSLD